jgi:tetratricopeptide (TPR) repeat protein
LNVEIYPDAFNTYDSLGEGYMEAGQNELAIQNYERSLELNPGNDNARQMLGRMGVEDEG